MPPKSVSLSQYDTPRLACRQDGSTLQLLLQGQWKIADGTEPLRPLRRSLVDAKFQRLTFNVEKVTNWDSSLLAFLVRSIQLGKEHKLDIDTASLPQSIQDLLGWIAKKGRADDSRSKETTRDFFYHVGCASLNFKDSILDVFAFIGDIILCLSRCLYCRVKLPWRDIWSILYQASVQALPIVALISFLVGFILAFVGAVQLEQFGATIFIANLVGVAMTREMGSIMTAVIMSGRTGAAYAASLGSMKVTEEIDALRTIGVSPVFYLVLPRVIGLTLMMPMLSVFAAFIGVGGGIFTGVFVMDLNFWEYLNQTKAAVDVADLFIGIIKGFVFGTLVATSGCLRGIQCGNSANAVGVAATSAVVTGITLVIIADAIFAVVLNILGI